MKTLRNDKIEDLSSLLALHDFDEGLGALHLSGEMPLKNMESHLMEKARRIASALREFRKNNPKAKWADWLAQVDVLEQEFLDELREPEQGVTECR